MENEVIFWEDLQSVLLHRYKENADHLIGKVLFHLWKWQTPYFLLDAFYCKPGVPVYFYFETHTQMHQNQEIRTYIYRGMALLND